MAVLLETRRSETDPLSETYFVRAADALNIHQADPGHACAPCRASWPCPPALAAAFILDLHAS